MSTSVKDLLVLPTSFPKMFGLKIEFLSFLGISQGKKNLLVSPSKAEGPSPILLVITQLLTR